MVIGSLRIEILLFDSHSLKEKRRPRQQICDRIRARFSVAVAEVADQDTWNKITLGIVTVGAEAGPVEAVLRQVSEAVAELGDGRVIKEKLEFFRA